eukprot:scaffold456224_cov98-Attheya_sp.AAC.1
MVAQWCVMGMVIVNTDLLGETPRADSTVDREVDQCIQGETSQRDPHPTIHQYWGFDCSLTTYTVRALNPSPMASGMVGLRDFDPSTSTSS